MPTFFCSVDSGLVVEKNNDDHYVVIVSMRAKAKTPYQFSAIAEDCSYLERKNVNKGKMKDFIEGFKNDFRINRQVIRCETLLAGLPANAEKETFKDIENELRNATLRDSVSSELKKVMDTVVKGESANVANNLSNLANKAKRFRYRKVTQLFKEISEYVRPKPPITILSPGKHLVHVGRNIAGRTVSHPSSELSSHTRCRYKWTAAALEKKTKKTKRGEFILNNKKSWL